MLETEVYVIVQAGGRGSRLRHHTWNKPKCLVSVFGKPILYHLFESFPGSKFLIIGDYLFNQLKTYLELNPPSVDYRLLRTSDKGTSAGIANALDLVPAGQPVVVTWSDLIISRLPPWPDKQKLVVCTTSTFTCRWTVSEEEILQECAGSNRGVIGLFFLPDKRCVLRPPDQGEFVKWLAGCGQIFIALECNDVQELGDFSALENANDREGFSRFFNRIEIGEDVVTKTVIDPNYSEVHENEVRWYDEVSRLGFRRVPKIHSKSPLVMERIRGKHAFQYHDLTDRERGALLANYLDSLISLHDLGSSESKSDEIVEVYLNKTLARLQSVAKIIPGFGDATVTVNGRKCFNPFAHEGNDFLQSLIPRLIPDKFVPIHGDPTFSNTIVDDKLRIWFIDPRGSFCRPGIFGDAWYDFAKVYYSVVGGYDFFNRRKFKLHVDRETVEVLMEEPAFSKVGRPMFKEYFGDDLSRIQVIHALIWLSLTGYVKDDVDSVLGAFYQGLYWLEEGGSRV